MNNGEASPNMHCLMGLTSIRIAVGVRITQMWKTYTLSARLCIILCTVFLAASIAGVFLLRIFAVEQLVDESEPAGQSVSLVADALNGALSASSNPEATLIAFGSALKRSGPDVIKFMQAGNFPPAQANVTTGARPRIVPNWFVDFLALPNVARYYPVMIKGKRVGDLAYEPDISAHLFEVWISFLAIIASGVGFMFFTTVIIFLTVGRAVRPLRDLGTAVARLRDGDYAHRVASYGPPEIRQSCEAVNELADTLTYLDRENRTLLRRMVSLQDDERRDIARELHDELGPLLFAIHADAIAMLDSAGVDQQTFDSPPRKVLASVKALQLTNRRILDRLRPLYIEELGLELSIEELIRKVRAQSAIRVAVEIDPALSAVDSVVSQTVYRLLQEGVTNVLRHAFATEMSLKAAVSERHVLVEISDNGVGMAPGAQFGRGLTGMHERARALGGTFEISRSGRRTCVRCKLAISQSASEIP
jgi:two-component system sensor histidine kinase UhpB